MEGLIETNHNSVIDQNGKLISANEISGILKVMNGLPFVGKIDDIMNGLDKSDVILLEGATGSGKSTGIAPTIHDYLRNVLGIEKPDIRLIQPRVAAAIGLAGRISVEQQIRHNDTSWQLGEGVGYLTGRGKNSSKDSRILLQTSGHELRRQMGGGDMPDAIILDEFHTKDILMQILAYIAKGELGSYNNRMKVVISSATLNRLETLKSFESITNNMPIISVEGRTFPIESSEFKPADFQKKMGEILKDGGSTLIFQPGKKDIKDTIDFLKNNSSPTDVTIFPFHGDMSLEDQKMVVNYKPREGEQVIIVATNSAEESLTIGFLDNLVDSGLVKIASVDHNGTDRLDLERSSVASVEQRKGRVGRTSPGRAFLANDSKDGERDEFTEAEICHTTIEDEILMLAFGGVHFGDELIKHEQQKRKMLTDDPDPKLVEISYKRLIQFGALDENGYITELGKKLVGYPISTRGSRILHESIERDVSEDISEIVSIVEHNGFLISGGTWEESYKKNTITRKKSDLFFELSIYRDFTSRNLNEETFNFFVFENNLTGCPKYIDYLNSGKMFFELIDSDALELFGVNKKSLEKISETLVEIHERMKKNGIEISSMGDMDDKIISLISGNLDHIYSYSKKDKGFINEYSEDKTVYQQSNISGVDLGNNENFYIGNPFIIGGRSIDDDDMCLLTGITSISKESLLDFQDKLILESHSPTSATSKGHNKASSTVNPRVKDTNVQSSRASTPIIPTNNSVRTTTGETKPSDEKEPTIPEQVVVSKFENVLPSKIDGLDSNELRMMREYSRVINKVNKNTEIDPQAISHKLAIKDIHSLNKGDHTNDSYNSYCSLLIFYKSLNKAMRKEILERYSRIEILTCEKFELMKAEKWLQAFVSSSRDILDGNEVSIAQMSIGKSDNASLLLSDPAIVKLGLLSSSTKLKELYTYIRNNFKTLKITEGSIHALNNLFSSDNRKFNNATKNQFPKFITRLNNKLSINESKIQDMEQVPKSKQKLNELRKKSNEIKVFTRNIQNFYELAIEMRSDVDLVNFKQVIFRVSDNKNPFLTKKHLLSILGDIVFNGDFLKSSSRAHQKLLSRMNKYLGENLNPDEIKQAHQSIKILSDADSNEASQKNANKIFTPIFKKIKDHQGEDLNKNLEVENKIEVLYQGELSDIYESIHTILSHTFEDEYLVTISPQIQKYVKRMLGFSLSNIDAHLIDFIGGLSPDHRLDHSELFEDIEEYNHYVMLLKFDEYKGRIPKDFQDGKISQTEFQDLFSKVQGIIVIIDSKKAQISNALEKIKQS